MAGLDRPLLGMVLGDAFFSAILSALGEVRIDAYASITVLIYFLAVAFSDGLRRVRGRWVIDAILLAVFSAAVAYRVWMVLVSG